MVDVLDGIDVGASGVGAAVGESVAVGVGVGGALHAVAAKARMTSEINIVAESLFIGFLLSVNFLGNK